MTLGIPEWWLGLAGVGWGRGGRAEVPALALLGDGVGGREGKKMDAGMRGIGKAAGPAQPASEIN